MKNLVALAELDSHDCKLRDKGFCICTDPFREYKREKWLRFQRRMDEVRKRSININ